MGDDVRKAEELLRDPPPGGVWLSPEEVELVLRALRRRKEK